MLSENEIQYVLHLAAQTDGPFYVYSLNSIRHRAESLRSALPADVEVFYSLKANSHPQLVSFFRELGFGGDVASYGELRLALDSGYVGQAIEFTGPGKTPAELEAAVESDVSSIVIESIQELNSLQTICAKLGKNISAHVRLNPKAKLNSSGRLVTDEVSQFGIEETEFEAFRRALDLCANVDVIGTHTHSQTQTLNVDHAIANYGFAIEAAAIFARVCSLELRYINLGGGIGIPYSVDQKPVDTSIFGTAVTDLLASTRKKYGWNSVRFRLEFGRFLVGEAGAFITRVLYTKTSAGKIIAITDGGFTQAQIACGDGQLVRRNLPIRVLGASPGTALERVTVAGPSCYGQDILAREAELPHLDPGSLIAVENVGAYGYSFSPNRFLRQREAAEYVIAESSV